MMRTLLAVLLLTAFAAAQPKYHVFGLTQTDVWPLANLQGDVIQLNVSTFGGGLVKGTYNSQKHGGICNTNYEHCYGYDGRGNWRFLFAGDTFCRATCTYTATGNLTVSKPIPLPDGSVILQFNAVLYGTFVSDSGVTKENVMAYYSSFTSPAISNTTFPADGGLTIVFQDN